MLANTSKTTNADLPLPSPRWVQYRSTQDGRAVAVQGLRSWIQIRIATCHEARRVAVGGVLLSLCSCYTVTSMASTLTVDMRAALDNNTTSEDQQASTKLSTRWRCLRYAPTRVARGFRSGSSNWTKALHAVDAVALLAVFICELIDFQLPGWPRPILPISIVK